MADPGYNQLVTDLTRDVIAQTAPQELRLFRALSEAYINDPEKALSLKPPKDDILGFGIEDAVTFVTPIALAVLTDVLNYLAEHVIKTIKDEGAERLSDTLKRFFKKFQRGEQGPPKSPPPLTREHMRQVHQLVFEKARQLRLSEGQSTRLADAVVACLVTTPS